MRSLTAPVPRYEWPVHRERPEGDHPGHGEGSDESPSTIGVAASGAMTNVAAQHVWFHSDFTVIPATQFFAELYVSRTPVPVIQVEPQTCTMLKVALPRRMVGTRSGR